MRIGQSPFLAPVQPVQTGAKQDAQVKVLMFHWKSLTCARVHGFSGEGLR
jgi:hypothetical protein